MTPRIVQFDPPHVDDVVRLWAAERWTSFRRENTADGLSAPGVVAVVAKDVGEVRA
jgi:hypothetical protein